MAALSARHVVGWIECTLMRNRRMHSRCVRDLSWCATHKRGPCAAASCQTLHTPSLPTDHPEHRRWRERGGWELSRGWDTGAEGSAAAAWPMLVSPPLRCCISALLTAGMTACLATEATT